VSRGVITKDLIPNLIIIIIIIQITTIDPNQALRVIQDGEIKMLLGINKIRAGTITITKAGIITRTKVGIITRIKAGVIIDLFII
jgi:hypothetical protein